MKTHLKLPAILTILAIGLSGCIWVGPHGGYRHPYGGGYDRPPPPPAYGYHNGY